MTKIIESLINLFPVTSTDLPYSRRSLGSKVVAHAMGDWNGEKYLNCLEAFETNYSRGARVFETDLHITSDDKTVLFHEGYEKRFGLPNHFTESQFLNAKPFGATLMNLVSLVQLTKKYPDVKIVTDVKTDNVAVLSRLVHIFKSENADFKQFIIPQIYHPNEFNSVKELGFESMIFTVYRFRKMKNLTARLLRKHPEIIALTVPDKWIESKNYIELSQKCSIDIFVHSIESEDRRDYLYERGVFGIYTPNLI